MLGPPVARLLRSEQFLDGEFAAAQEEEAPRVAVIIAAKDAAGTIARAVRSALAEPEAAEVIVVDDGSRDSTAAFAQACDDGSGRLRVIRQPNRGPSAARNAAIAASVSPFLCVLDSDDFFTPGRLATIFAAAGSDWELVCDKLLLAQEGAEEGPYEKWRADETLPSEIALEDYVVGNITQASRPRQELGYLKPLIRRSFLDAHRLRFREEIWLGEDYLLYSEILARGGRFRTVEHHGYVAVQRTRSLSHSHPAEHLGALYRASLSLARIEGVSCGGRRALRRHRASLRRRWMHHRLIDAKKQGRWAEAARLILLTPSLVSHLCAAAMRSSNPRT